MSGESAGGPRGDRGERGAWRRLPAISETMGPPPLVAPSRPFAADLGAGNPPPPILAPLSHGKGIDAPKGIVVGLARAATSISGPPTPPPVQRSARPGARSVTELAEMREEAAPAPESTIAAPAARVEAAPIVSSPARRLSVASPEPPVRRSMTRAPEAAVPAPAPGRIGRAALASLAAAPFAPAQPQRAPATPDAAPAAAVPAGRGPASIDAVPAAEAPRLTIGQARRIGLGAPLTAATAAARLASPVSMPLASTAAPGVQRSPEHTEASSPSSTESPVQGPVAAPTAAGGITAHQPGAPVAPLVSAAPTLSRPAIAVPIARPAPRRAPEPAAPLVSRQPIRSHVQRAPLTIPTRKPDGAGEEAPASAAARPAAARPAEAPVKVHRGSEAADLSKTLDARSFTHAGEIFLPKRHGSLESGPGRALLAHELTHVVQQRRLGSSLPREDTPHGRRLESEAVAAERGPNLPLAAAAPGPSGKHGEHTGAEPQRAPIVAHASDDSATVHVASPVQRAPESRRATGHSPKVPSSDQELEELAGKLYAKIGRRLRSELLVDRERAGLALDVR